MEIQYQNIVVFSSQWFGFLSVSLELFNIMGLRFNDEYENMRMKAGPFFQVSKNIVTCVCHGVAQILPFLMNCLNIK